VAEPAPYPARPSRKRKDTEQRAETDSFIASLLSLCEEEESRRSENERAGSVSPRDELVRKSQEVARLVRVRRRLETARETFTERIRDIQKRVEDALQEVNELARQ
jgi:hypothetical protein